VQGRNLPKGRPRTPKFQARIRKDAGFFIDVGKNAYLRAPFVSPNGAISGPPVRIRQQGIIQKHQKMPKVKTNSSAKKRFKVTGTGKITFQKAFKRHILTKKSKKRKRVMAKKGEVSQANLDFVKRLLRLR
jgi:large subunit ribosomal protein L35